MEAKNVMDMLASVAHSIEKNEPLEVRVSGKTYRIGQTKRKVLENIISLQYDIRNLSKKDMPEKRKLRLLGTYDAKVAAYLILNSWSYIRPLHALYWRYLYRFGTSEIFSAVIEKGIRDEDTAFFLKNFVTSSSLLVARMSQIKAE